jgi:hypothetical protein
MVNDISLIIEIEGTVIAPKQSGAVSDEYEYAPR